MKIPLKIAVLSDAHGVYPALEAVWQDAQPFQPDMVLFAGDFTRGPYPAEVIHFLRSIHAHMILGNDDINLLHFTGGKCLHRCWKRSSLDWRAGRSNNCHQII